MITNKVENNSKKTTFKENLSILLSASNWVSNAYTITNDKITTNTKAIIAMGISTDEQYQQMVEAKTSRAITCEAGKIILMAQGKTPTIDIPIVLHIIDW